MELLTQMAGLARLCKELRRPRPYRETPPKHEHKGKTSTSAYSDHSPGMELLFLDAPEGWFLRRGSYLIITGPFFADHSHGYRRFLSGFWVVLTNQYREENMSTARNYGSSLLVPTYHNPAPPMERLSLRNKERCRREVGKDGELGV